MITKMPQGWLSVTEAVKWLVQRKYPGKGSRVEGEAAWRAICQLACDRKIRSCILTVSGATVEADPAQFAGLQERYLFQLNEIRGTWPGDKDEETGEPREMAQELVPQDKFIGADGRIARGQLCFNEADLQKAFDHGGKASKSKPSLNDRKRAAVIAAFESLGRGKLEALGQKERELEVTAKVAADHNLTVSDRYVRDHWRDWEQWERS
jgi:hypothetical protein